MPQSRLWVKLDASYYNDAALLEAGERAEVLFVRAIALSKQLLSDGFLTRFQLESCGLRALSSRISALVRVGLWTPINPPDGGEVRAWKIRSYLRYNTSAQRVEEISDLRREAGRKGGRPRQTESKLLSKLEANGKQLVSTMYNPEAEAEAEAVPVPEGTGSRKPPEETPRTRSPKPPYQPSDLAQRALAAWISYAPLPVTSSEEAALKTLDDVIRLDHVGEEDLLLLCRHGAEIWVPAGYIASPCKLRRPTRSGEMKTWEAILRQARNGKSKVDPAEIERSLKEEYDAKHPRN